MQTNMISARASTDLSINKQLTQQTSVI